MAADVQIRFKSDSQQAQRDIEALQKEIAELRTTLGQSERASASAGQGVQQLGAQSRQTAASVDVLESQMNAVRRETLDYRTSLSRLNAELAENRKALLTADAAGKETLETRNKQIRAEQGLLRARQQSSSLLLSSLQQEKRELGSVSGALGQASGGTSILNRAAGELAGTLGAIGIIEVAFGIQRIGGASLKAAGEMEGMIRGLEDAYGSTQLATARFSEFVELAKNPGLGIQQLTTYDAIFKNIGGTASENNVIFTGLAKGITTYGGSLHDVTGALHQLQQAMGGNRIVAQDFRPILERTRGTFLTTAQEVHGFTGGIDEMRASWQASGQTLKDYLLPIFERMNERFAGAPVNAYTNKIGNLEDAFELLQAAIGKKLLPVFNPLADGLLNIIEFVTEAAEKTDALKTAFDGLGQEIDKGTTTALESFIQTLDTAIKKNEEYLQSDSIWKAYKKDVQEAQDELIRIRKLITDATKQDATPESIQVLKQAAAEANQAYQQQISIVVALVDKYNELGQKGYENLQEWKDANEALEKARSTSQGLSKALEQVQKESQTASHLVSETATAATQPVKEAQKVMYNYGLEIAQATGEVEKWKQSLSDASSIQEIQKASEGLEAAQEKLNELEKKNAEQTKDRLKIYRSERQAQQAVAENAELIAKKQTAAAKERADAEEKEQQRLLEYDQKVLSERHRIIREGLERYREAAAERSQIVKEEIESELEKRREAARILEDLMKNQVSVGRDRLSNTLDSDFASPDAKGQAYNQAQQNVVDYYNFLKTQRTKDVKDAEQRTKIIERLDHEMRQELKKNADLYITDITDRESAAHKQRVSEKQAEIKVLQETARQSTKALKDEEDATKLVGLRKEAAADATAVYNAEVDLANLTITDSEQLTNALALAVLKLQGTLKGLGNEVSAPFKKMGEETNEALAKIRDLERELGFVGSGNKPQEGSFWQMPDTMTALIQSADLAADAMYRLGEASNNDNFREAGKNLSDIANIAAGIASGNPIQAIGAVVNMGVRFYEEAQEREREKREKRKEQEAKGLDRITTYERGSAELRDFRNSFSDVDFEGLDIHGVVEAYLEQVRTAIIAGANIDWDEVSEVVTGIISGPVSEARAAIDTAVEDVDFLIRQERSTSEINTAIQSAIATITTNIAVLMDANEDVTGEVERLNALRLLDTSQSQGALYQRGKHIRDNAPDYTNSNDDHLSYDELVAEYGQTEADIVIQQRAEKVAGATPAESIAPVIESINEGIEIINAAILSIETRIDQSNDPEEIAQLLSQVPDLIRQKYEMLRKALEARFGAGEITESVFNASLSELQSNEAREIERHSDAVLANTLRIIDEDAQLINASVTALETQIDASNDPAEIATLLDQIPALITEKYRLLRQALDEKYVAGEISVDVYNASLKAINNSQASETERHSDAVLANTLSEIDDDVALIDANIEALQFSVSGSDDPQAVAGFLEAIRILIADKYRRLRERLNELLAAEEISQTAFDAATLGLTTAENRALAGIDTQALNAISAETQEQVAFINGSIENLRLSLQLTDAPAEIQQILDAIKILTVARFSVLRKELEALRETMKPEEYQQALKGLNLAETLALENLDAEKFDAISAEAQKQVTAINTDIENLRLSLQLTDNPAERQAILGAIRVLTVARFTVLREELEKIKDSLDPADYNRALKGINLGEQVALSNIDTEKFDEISAEAMRQVEAINGTIENLRLALQLTTDPAETQQILDAIKILTAARFDVLIQELHDIRDTLSDDDFNRALTGLGLGKQIALNNIDSEKFSAISAAAKKQVTFIEGAIDNLELALQLTDDPEEMQRIIASIRILTAKRFDRLIQELKDLRDSFDSDAEFNQALEGLELGKAVALKGIDDRSAGVAVERIGTALSEADGVIADLFGELAEQTTPEGVTRAVERLRNAIQAKYFVIREKINASAESEEEKARQIAAVNIKETGELEGLNRQGLDAFSSLVDTAQFLLDNATESEFGTRRQNLISAINTFYDERIAFINGLDLSGTDRANMLEVVRIQRNIALDAIPQMHESVTERLEMERELQGDIDDLRDREAENEADRQEALVELAEDTARRRLEIEEKLQEDLDDLRRDRIDSAEDLQREYLRDLQDLQTQTARRLFGDDIISFADLTDTQRQRVEDDTEYQRKLFDLNRERDRERQDLETDFGILTPHSGGYRHYREQLESGELTDHSLIERLFGRQGLDDFIENQRSQEDLEDRRSEREAEINAAAEATATALTTTLTPLLEKQNTTADKEATTADKQSTTADKEATTADKQSTTADKAATTTETQSSTVADLKAAINAFQETVPTFAIGAADLKDGAASLKNIDRLVSALEDIPTALSGFENLLDTLPERFSDGFESSLSSALDNISIGLRPSLNVDLLTAAPEKKGVLSAFIPDAPDNRLFHFSQTDAIARRVARHEMYREKQDRPNYLPSAEQIRNSGDVAREIMAGIQEAQQRGGGDIGNPRPLEIIIKPADIVFKDEVIGRSMDETLVQLDQDGRSIGSYQRPQE